MPLSRYALYTQGMQICASVWPVGNPGSLMASQHLAHEGRCFVVLSGSYLTKAHIPSDFELLEELEAVPVPDVIFNGGSTIIGPDGRLLVEPVYGKEMIAYADIDLERIIEEKQTLDVVGHYARPEVFKLTINRESFSPYQNVSGTVDIGQELARLEAMAGECSKEVLLENIRKRREKIGG